MRCIRYLVVASALGVGMMASSYAQAPKPPPEIQAILDKKKHKQPLTMDDIRKLQEWAAGIQQHLPVNVPQPGNAPADGNVAPVQVRFDVDVHYTRKSSSGTQTFQLSASAPAELIAKINGTDDYTSGLLDPNAKISSFLFQSSSPGGTGEYKFHADEPDHITDFPATMSSVGAGMMLVTVGGDTLGVIPGQINGAVRGTYHSVDRSGKATDKAYEGEMRESVVHLLFPWEGHVTKDPKHPTTKPRAQISYAALVAAVHSGKPTPIRITEHFDWNDHGEQVEGDEVVTITVRPSKDPVEARIVADSRWDTWKPMGPTPYDNFGNKFKVHVELVQPTTGKPYKGPRKAVATEYRLEEVSHLPGVCTNWPQPGKLGYDTKPDLFFAVSNKVGSAPDADRQTFDLGAADWNQIIEVESRDYAAWGHLRAKVTLDSGDWIDARFEPNKNRPFLPLPRDDDDNHMADAWEPGHNLDPEADDEDSPAGFRSKGDGLTAMEEYRGFFVATDHVPIAGESKLTGAGETFQRFDPKQRELIVAIETKDPARASQIKRGIAMFESASHVTVYAVAAAERMGPHAKDYVRPRAAVLNPTPPDSKKADATRDSLGVWISDQVEVPDSVARSWPYFDGEYCSDHPFECEHSPSTIKYVALGANTSSETTVGWMINLIDPDPITGLGPNTTKARPDIDAYLRRQGIKDADRRAAVAYARAHKDTLVDEMAVFAVAHELGHTIGGQHHGVLVNDHPELGLDSGDPNCPMRYWQALNSDNGPDSKHPVYNGLKSDPITAPDWIRFLNGSWNPAKTGPKGPWRFDHLEELGFDP